MADQRWDRLEELLERAASLPPNQRPAFVERESCGDPELLYELSTLLVASEGADAYVSRLRRELLGTDVEGIVRNPLPAAAGPDPWIGRTISHYEIRDRIGGGGMGVIYLAHDLRLGRRVAIKFIAPEIRRDSEARRRFLHEARAASALDHPNICTIHEFAETEEGRLFMVMAAYDGETLRSRLERGPIPDAEVLGMTEQVCRALAVAHEHGVVHRDVKPDNLFVTRDGLVKLLDFGLARTSDSLMSGVGVVEGTVAYMSPERIGGRRADERSDVWSVGVILYEMLTGARPFAAADPQIVVQRILTSDPDLGTARPDLAPPLIDLVQRALARDPAQRFANGRELLDALLGLSTRPGQPPRRRRGPTRRALASGAGVAGLLVVGTLLTFRGPSRPALTPTVSAAPITHVLWVDDNPDGNAAVAEEMQSRGVKVTIALNTTEALQRYDPAEHQLVISDMGRYEGTNEAYVPRAGFDLLAGLQARNPAVQVVICTSERAAAAHRAEALSAGAFAVVTDCRDILDLLDG